MFNNFLEIKKLKLSHLIILLLIVRLVFFLPLINDKEKVVNVNVDAKHYCELAYNLSLKKIYQSQYAIPKSLSFKKDIKEENFDTIRPPLFPLFLSLFYLIYPSPYWASFFYLLLSIILLIIAKNYLTEKTFIIFSLLFILSPQINFHSLLPMSDLLFGIFLFFTILFLKENKNTISLIFLSLLPYVKPVAILLPPFFALFYLIKKKIKLMFLYLLIPYLAILPWCFLTYKKTGLFTFSTIPYINLFSYYVPFAKGLKEKIGYQKAKEIMNEELKNLIGDNYSQKEFYEGIRKIAFKELKKAPLHFLISHSLFSLYTLISPISFKPLLIYLTGKEAKNPLKEEVFSYFLKKKFLTGLKIFLERLKILGIWGIFLLLYSTLFLFFILFNFIKSLKREKPILELLIILPLTFSTGIIAHDRFRILFEPLIYLFIARNLILKSLNQNYHH